MAQDLYCPHRGVYVGNCGHLAGGDTKPHTISGTCKCINEYTVTCYGGCLNPASTNDES
jgi:hypothetical protein